MTTEATSPEVIRPPASELKGWLVDRSDEAAFVVSSPAPSCWRLTALSDFDGTSWGLNDTLLSNTSGPLASGFEPVVGGDRLTQTFEITGLDGQLLPAAFSPVRVESLDVGVAFDAEVSALVATSATLQGLEYTVESLVPRYDVARLRAADAAPTGDRAERHLALPADFPAELAEQAPPDHGRRPNPVRPSHRLAELSPRMHLRPVDSWRS